MKWAKSITPLPAAVKLPSAARSLACAMASASAEGAGGRFHQAAALGGVRLLEEVGGVEHDAQPRARHLVEEAAGGGGVGDDVGELGLDAERDVEALGDGERLVHLGEEVAPGVAGARCPGASATGPPGRGCRCRA